MTERHPPVLDQSILGYYTRRSEETRLERGLSQLEAVRTRELIERHLPRTPATILDVGGAAGYYASWLASLDYTVHLSDPVPRLVEEARRRNALLPRPIASCSVGDARALEYVDASADVVLLLGPLYHLTSRGDRARALREARRVLRPGGLLFAAAISRWASLLDCLVRNVLGDPQYASEVERALHDGQHRNLTDLDGHFTTAYFHRPEELHDEMTTAGFSVVGFYGVEGPARMLPDFDVRWSDPKQRADLLRAARVVESEPSFLGLSGHLLTVGAKP
jgi:SAM-dependent methyltransferase